MFFNHNDWNKEKDNVANKLIKEFFIKKYKNKIKAINEFNSINGIKELKNMIEIKKKYIKNKLIIKILKLIIFY